MATEEQPIKKVEPGGLLADVALFYTQGYRLVHICCTRLADDSFELTYAFDKDYKLHNLRITVNRETEIPSITQVYGGAFLYENEINELFGVKIKGINLDFGGHLYKKKIAFPFSMKMAKVDATCLKGQ